MSLYRMVNCKGFQMQFSNGLTISVMFGEGNYCEHKWSDKKTDILLNGKKKDLRKLIQEPWESKQAGVAVWRTSDTYWASLTSYGDESWCGDPVGYVSPDLVARIIAYVGHKDTYMTDEGRLSQKGSTDVLDVSKWEEEE